MKKIIMVITEAQLKELFDYSNTNKEYDKNGTISASGNIEGGDDEKEPGEPDTTKDWPMTSQRFFAFGRGHYGSGRGV